MTGPFFLIFLTGGYVGYQTIHVQKTEASTSFRGVKYPFETSLESKMGMRNVGTRSKV